MSAANADAATDDEYAKLLALVAKRRAPVKPAQGVLDIGDRPALGEPHAPVAIVEFGSFQCGYCLRHALQTMPELMAYVDRGEVIYVFHDFPSQAEYGFAAEAALCAAEQDKYLEFRQALLAQQATLSVAAMETYATEVGLELPAFNECVSSGRQQEAVGELVAAGRDLGIKGTPTFLIGAATEAAGRVEVSRRIDGAQPYPLFAREIDALLEAR